MRVALKLNGIEQEHLQELYDAAGVARDELPYTEQFDQLCQDFQDRTFKNAELEQVFAAILKYVRSSTNSAGDVGHAVLDTEQVKQLKIVLKRQAKGGKVLPYSSEFDAALKEFNGLAKTQLSARDFWLSIVRTQGRSRRPPKRTAAKSVSEAEDDAVDDED